MKRAQQGSFHVYSRGNKRNIVFYNSEDIIDFLRVCNKTAEKYNTVLEEFVVMTNHFHLHLITDSLTEFMRRFLHNYVVRYNQRHKEKGKLFETPFGSAIKNSEEWQIKSKLYILQNPVRAGICKHPKEYMWNSYRFHYPSGRKSELEKLIKINTLNTDRYFYIKKNFDRALENELIPDEELLNATPRDWPGPSDSEVIKEFYKLLNGRPLYSLTRREVTGLIYSLFIRTGANLRQISSITHENYEFVRKLCLTGPEKTG